MKIKKAVVALGAAFALTLSLAGCSNDSGDKPKDEKGTSVQNTADEKTSSAEKGQAVGINEIPVGDSGPQTSGPLTVDLVYFQAIDMEQGSVLVPPASESDMHFEVDVATNEKAAEIGYEADQFMPYLEINVKIYDQATGGLVKDLGTMMPMVASDGPHYGNNIKLEPGEYRVEVEIPSPADKFMLHTGKDTSAVDGRFWTEPLKFTFENWKWDGQLL